MKDSDDNRQEFARYYLDNFRFLYKNSDGDNRKVSITLATSNYTITVPPQKYKGAFRGPFVLQTFAACLNAFQGACRIVGLDDPNKPIKKSYGGLALSAAAVSVLAIVSNCS